MAKTHTYLVSFNRAKRTDRGYYQVTFDMAAPSVKHTVEASTFEALETEVRRLAGEFGLPCSPHVRLPDRTARKPAGFDKWYSRMNIIDEGGNATPSFGIVEG